MRTLAGWLMIANAALFFFGGVQHVGVSIGRFHEPLSVESICLWYRLPSQPNDRGVSSAGMGVIPPRPSS